MNRYIIWNQSTRDWPTTELIEYIKTQDILYSYTMYSITILCDPEFITSFILKYPSIRNSIAVYMV